MHYHIWTIGCQMNVADSQRVAAGLERLGYTPAARAEDADVMILNTCVVRQQPEDKAVGRLNQLRRVKERHPERILALMGCMVGVKETERRCKRASPGWTSSSRPPIPPSCGRCSPNAAIWTRRKRSSPTPKRAVWRSAASIRSCRPRSRRTSSARTCPSCSAARTPARTASSPTGGVRSAAARRKRFWPKRGRWSPRGSRRSRCSARSWIATATICPNSTGAAETPLVTLLRQVHEIEGLERLRFLTSHPNWMKDDLLRAVAELPKVCEHIEVPIQIRR